MAIYYKEGTLEPSDTRPLLFKDAGDRVALLLVLRVKPVTSPSPSQHILRARFNAAHIKTGHEFVIVNTHLTFPHHEFDIRLRGKQMEKILTFLHDYTNK